MRRSTAKPSTSSFEMQVVSSLGEMAYCLHRRMQMHFEYQGPFVSCAFLLHNTVVHVLFMKNCQTKWEYIMDYKYKVLVSTNHPKIKSAIQSIFCKHQAKGRYYYFFHPSNKRRRIVSDGYEIDFKKFGFQKELRSSCIENSVRLIFYDNVEEFDKGVKSHFEYLGS